MARKKGGNNSSNSNPSTASGGGNNGGTGSPKSSSPARQQVRGHNSGGNGNSTPKRQLLTEKELDSQLRTLGLVRKAIPKDGACLFRATSEQLHATQNYHLDLRRACVTYLRDHKEDFEPFVCTDGMPYDHYLYEMSKPDCWAGQAELQALSLHYKVNFIIYSEQPRPTRIDNGFAKEITLCFLGGNHYDSVYKERTHDVATFAQELVYELMSRAMGEKVLSPKSSEPYTYKNVGLDCYLANLREQRDKDKKIAEDLSQTTPSNLSGFYRKEGGAFDQQGWEKQMSRRSKKEKNKVVKLDLDFSLTPEEVKERKQLKEDMERIAQMEKQELAEGQLLTDQELFPALAPKHAASTPTETTTTTTTTTPTTQQTQEASVSASTATSTVSGEEEKKGVVWGGQTNWKNLFAPPVATPAAPAIPKKSRRSKKKERKQPQATLQAVNSVITGLVNVDDRATPSITFGSLTPSSPVPSRLSSESTRVETTPTTSGIPSTSTSTSSPQPHTPSPPSTTTPVSQTTPKDLGTAQKIGHLEANGTIFEELRNLSVVFGDFPPQSMNDIPTTQSVSFRLPKQKTKRKEEETTTATATATATTPTPTPAEGTKPEKVQQHKTDDKERSTTDDHSHSNGITPKPGKTISEEEEEEEGKHASPSKPNPQKYLNHNVPLNHYYNSNPYMNGDSTGGRPGPPPPAGGYEMPGYYISYYPPHLMQYPPHFYGHGQVPPPPPPQDFHSVDPSQTMYYPHPPPNFYYPPVYYPAPYAIDGTAWVRPPYQQQQQQQHPHQQVPLPEGTSSTINGTDSTVSPRKE